MMFHGFAIKLSWQFGPFGSHWIQASRSPRCISLRHILLFVPIHRLTTLLPNSSKALYLTSARFFSLCSPLVCLLLARVFGHWHYPHLGVLGNVLLYTTALSRCQVFVLVELAHHVVLFRRRPLQLHSFRCSFLPLKPQFLLLNTQTRTSTFNSDRTPQEPTIRLLDPGAFVFPVNRGNSMHS